MNPLSTTYSGSVASIDLANLKKNLEYLRQKSRTDDVMAVVKANAYGHGAVQVSRYLETYIREFAVATVDEGIQLRKGGIEKPILVFGLPRQDTSEAYVKHDLTATICHPDQFRLLSAGTGYQVNIDTGMRRAGLDPLQTAAVRTEMENHRDLTCRGIYSHYATADDPGSRLVREQHNRFLQVRSGFPVDIPAHMSNTAAVLHYDLDHLDMIRVGIGLAGYAPGRIQSDKLRPVLSWETRACLVRKISRGDVVSYGAGWKAPADGYLATLPVGYADGIPRRLTNRLKVKAGKRMVPVAGSITMDFCMVFLGDQPVEPGTPVQLLGPDGCWRADRWAAEAETVTHEILCRLTSRIHRRYSH
ncbi:MAG: alanine racemase [Balneolaceae bacterium]